MPLEPRAAVAEWKDGKLTVWTGTQRPFGVRGELASAFRIPEERVRVIVPDTGSGYGGKHTGEHAIEAARLAKAAGKPVKLVWTARGGVHLGVLPPGRRDRRRRARSTRRAARRLGVRQLELRRSAIRTPYDIPNQRIEFHPVELAAAAGFVSRRWPRPRITTRARCTWTRWRARWAGPARVPPART